MTLYQYQGPSRYGQVCVPLVPQSTFMETHFLARVGQIGYTYISLYKTD